MGKIFRYDKPALSIVIFLIFLLLTTMHGYASYREYDLLQKGYESYLSYQPEQAAEAFRTFLQEFPDSSAGDAALFWLGKSLMQAKSTDEAGHVFTALKRQFPDSPFVAFIVMQTEPSESEKLTTPREAEPISQLEALKASADIKQPEPAMKMDDTIIEPTMRTDTAVISETPTGKEPETVVAITIVGEQEAANHQSELSSEQAPDVMKKVEEPEGKESSVKEPVVKVPVVQEQEVKAVEMKDVEVPGTEVKEPEVKEPAQLPEFQGSGEETGKQAVEEKKVLPFITEEQTLSDSVGDVLPKEETPISGDNVRQEDEQVKTGELSRPRASESNTMTPAQTALNKVGMQGAIIWSTGDRNQDFIDEQILYNEAVKLNLSVDEDELNELRERYTLGIEEVDYLKRFLLICRLIDKKAKEIPGDKVVEVLSVRYKDAGQREQPELAAELQALANKGITFEEIGSSYPDIVRFKTIVLQELPDWIQERIQGLQNYEVGVIWSEEGYMILKPIIQLYSYDSFEELSSQEREKLTAYVRLWITELKGANPR